MVLPHQWLALLHYATPCLLLFSTAGKKMLQKESTCIECAWAKEISHRDINKRLEQKKKKTINNFPPPFTLFYVLPLSCAGEMGMDVTFHNISSLQLHHLLLLQHGLPTQSSLPRTAPTWVCTTGPSLRTDCSSTGPSQVAAPPDLLLYYRLLSTCFSSSFESSPWDTAFFRTFLIYTNDDSGKLENRLYLNLYIK